MLTDGMLNDARAEYSELDAFDVMAECFRRTANNTSMIGNWGELTGPILEVF